MACRRAALRAGCSDTGRSSELFATIEVVWRRLATGVDANDERNLVADGYPTAAQGWSGKEAGRFDPVDGSVVVVVIMEVAVVAVVGSS